MTRGRGGSGAKVSVNLLYTCFWFLIFDNYLYFGLYVYAEIHFLLLMVFEKASYNVSKQNSNIYAPCIYMQMWRIDISYREVT